jgi:hypothetical protein
LQQHLLPGLLNRCKEYFFERNLYSYITGFKFKIKSRPRRLSLMFVLSLTSDEVVQTTCPPMEVTAVFPTLTLLLAETLAPYPIAVAFVKLVAVASAVAPIKVHLIYFALVPPASALPGLR